MELRPSVKEEIRGLDRSEMGAAAYGGHGVRQRTRQSDLTVRKWGLQLTVKISGGKRGKAQYAIAVLLRMLNHRHAAQYASLLRPKATALLFVRSGLGYAKWARRVL